MPRVPLSCLLALPLATASWAADASHFRSGTSWTTPHLAFATPDQARRVLPMGMPDLRFPRPAPHHVIEPVAPGDLGFPVEPMGGARADGLLVAAPKGDLAWPHATIRVAAQRSSRHALLETRLERIHLAGVRSYRALKREADRLASNPPRTLRGASELACVAVAIYHEARDQSTHGQLAVASVIQQRALARGRWGSTPCEVVRPIQFSFMTSRWGFPRIDEQGPWKVAVSLAVKSLIDGPLPELAGADHYHATYVSPSWRHAMKKVGRIGAHIFYRSPAPNV